MDGSAADPAEICGTFADGSMAGKVALIRRGACDYTLKIINAQNAGAIAVIIYNDHRDYEPREPEVGSGVGITIPSMFITAIDGEALNVAVYADPRTGVSINCGR